MSQGMTAAPLVQVFSSFFQITNRFMFYKRTRCRIFTIFFFIANTFPNIFQNFIFIFKTGFLSEPVSPVSFLL